MTSPRELQLGVLAPLAPYFGRKVEFASNVKYSGAETEVDDINRQPTAPSGSTTIALRFDAPVPLRKASFLVENLILTMTAANDYIGAKLCDLPDRNVLISNAEFVGTAAFTGDFATNDDPSWGIGTAVASANPIATTAQDVLPIAALTNITAGAATALNASRVGASAADQTNVLVPDSATSALYLNFSCTDTQLASDGTITVNGTFDVYYFDLGNRGS